MQFAVNLRREYYKIAALISERLTFSLSLEWDYSECAWAQMHALAHTSPSSNVYQLEVMVLDWLRNAKLLPAQGEQKKLDFALLAMDHWAKNWDVTEPNQLEPVRYPVFRLPNVIKPIQKIALNHIIVFAFICTHIFSFSESFVCHSQTLGSRR